ncbi:MAG: ABC-F family ATP-binding cassette domain-containing protein [Actinobacteria bacterium]|nr:ABC-F family ATP-binding cassette domain-containing protein [Actinomycetota bacterium]
MLQVSGLRVDVGGVTLIDGVSFTVRAGEKVGLVGRNGAGKTSMLKVIGGANEASRGSVSYQGGLGYLPQDPRLDMVPDDVTALRHVLSGRGFDDQLDRMEKLRVAMEADPTERAIDRYTRAEERFRMDGGYSAESEVRRLAAGIGLADEKLDLPLGALSGGQRRRAEVVRILFAGSDVLLLDEPTNHLDADAKTWMLDFLRSYRGALVVISHDLDLLDEAITRVIHLDRGGDTATGTMHEYKGTYSQYVAAREADEVRLAKQIAMQAKEIDRMQNIIDRFGAKATKASMAHSLEKRIERLKASGPESSVARKTLKLRLPEPPHCARTVLEVSGLAVSYPGLDVFEDVTFDAGRGDRVLVMGLNGAGKTSLLRVLAGITEPVLGTVSWGKDVSVGYYAQEHEGIRSGADLVEHMREATGGMGDGQLRGLLGMFGLVGDKVFQDASTLSGGEKTKLALAQLVGGRHNVLLLDEPTNNLDPASRTAVADALSGWGGTLIVVSHDAEFVEALEPDRALLMPDGDVDHWHDDFLELVALA